ncbi:MAG: diversity-generating retroelement protein Avd [Anaerolineae bacterium]|nr:diversity-generating retroelement protein Avd [Anaerolineae bacterium]
MSAQSPIFIKTEAFMVWLYDHTAKFPRHERFRLARHIEEAMVAFHEQLLRATQAESPKSYLKEAQIQLNKARFYLRMALELKYTSPNQFQYASEYTTEIGNLLGGWSKKA